MCLRALATPDLAPMAIYLRSVVVVPSDCSGHCSGSSSVRIAPDLILATCSTAAQFHKYLLKAPLSHGIDTVFTTAENVTDSTIFTQYCFTDSKEASSESSKRSSETT